MSENWLLTLFGILLTANLTQSGVIFSLTRKVTKLEDAVKKACPWGSCPSYMKAKAELEKPNGQER